MIKEQATVQFAYPNIRRTVSSQETIAHLHDNILSPFYFDQAPVHAFRNDVEKKYYS
jgi:hypothetical protein